MTLFEIVKLVIGLLLVAFGLLLSLGVVIGWNDSPVAANLAGLFVIGVVPIVGGSYLSYAVLRARRRREAGERENRILQIAHDRQGVLSVQRLAMDSDLSLTEAKEVLDRYHVKGYCRMDVEDDGTIVYVFEELRG